MRIKLTCNNCLQSWYYDDTFRAGAQLSFHYAKEKHPDYVIKVEL